jgi:transposase
LPKQQEEQANGTMLNDNERTELLKLRAENKRLKMEKDILKKASAFFAREMK